MPPIAAARVWIEERDDTMQNLLHSVGEYLTPTLRHSNFLETGRLTPEEVLVNMD